MTIRVHRHETPEEMVAALGVPMASDSKAESTELPEVTATPCVECPWRRDSAAGWLGPYPAEQWIAIVHGEAAVACHITIKTDQSWEAARQCAGSAQFRANVLKSPRNPDIAVAEEQDDSLVFGGDKEFLDHHLRRG